VIIDVWPRICTTTLRVLSIFLLKTSSFRQDAATAPTSRTVTSSCRLSTVRIGTTPSSAAGRVSFRANLIETWSTPTWPQVVGGDVTAIGPIARPAVAELSRLSLIIISRPLYAFNYTHLQTTALLIHMCSTKSNSRPMFDQYIH